MRFLEHFRSCGRIDLSAKAVGVHRSRHYIWLQTDPEYAAAFDLCRPDVNGLLEDEAMRRAIEGTERPVTVVGKREIVREYDSRLLELLLVKRHPAFREVSDVPAPSTTIQVMVQHAGAPSAPNAQRGQIVDASSDTAIVRVRQ